MTDSNSESVCSMNVPKDYSISALDYCTQNELKELNSEKSKSAVKLNFGVDRLLAKSSESEKKSIERNPNNNLGLVLSSHAQQLMSSTSTSFHTQILKPFPLRFGATHNSKCVYISDEYRSQERDEEEEGMNKGNVDCFNSQEK
jgi:hypothetical protein